jgi:thymidylate kinase
MDSLIKKQKDFYSPDITFFLDLDAKIAGQRSSSRTDKEYFDSLDTQKRVREQYLKAVKCLKNTEKIVIIDGSKSSNEVTEAIKKDIDFLYGYT